jgi:hypothetical protein
MTTELLAAAQDLAENPHELQVYYLVEHNAELRRRNERLRKENDELRHLLIKMRKRVAEVMHYSLDDFK